MRMKPVVVGISVLVAVTLLVFAYLWYSGKSRNDTQPPVPAPGFPLATTTRPDGGMTNSSMDVAGRDGLTITVRDFVHNGVTIEDPANEDIYYLSGSSGVCLEDGSCPVAGNDRGFNIVYFEADGSFAVSLNEEPLGEQRRRAEQYLMQALGIGEVELCALRYTVGTTVYVNETYGSMGNLGFSFCPGAVKLP